MAYETKDNSGALFRNTKTKDTQPDYTGDGMVNGSKVRISAWVKTSKGGSKFMSLSFTPPRDAQTTGERSYDPLPSRGPGNMPPLATDDDVPF